MQQFVEEITYPQDPITVFSLFADHPWAQLLDSPDAHNNPNNMNRYSYIVFDPIKKITVNEGKLFLDDKAETTKDYFNFIKQQLNLYKAKTTANLPPFQGGAVGYFSYDLCHYIDNIPLPEKDHMATHDLSIGIYNQVISFEKRAWAIINDESLELAKTTMQKCLTKINNPGNNQQKQIQPQQIKTKITKQQYKQAVEKVKQYILEGDIFEANFTQRFEAQLPQDISAFDLYCRLRKENPSPFSAYLNLPDCTIASSSPERFLTVNNNTVETRPIKGTRPRGKTTAQDLQLAEELQQSEKDRAENIMIVDLMRNDISKVCEPNSIRVPQLCGLESFPAVHHLVSVVQGKLKPGLNALDLLKATFPGGSITGVPKIRAMQIISELEPVRRGPYCGSIACIGFNGHMDSSIVIRTFIIKNKQVSFNAGGAIVLDSDPEQEYQESLDKARSLKATLSHS